MTDQRYRCARCGRVGHLPVDCPWPLIVRWLLAALGCIVLGGLPLWMTKS